MGVLILFVAGCAFETSQIRLQNRQRVADLGIGMTREEVLNHMGTETFSSNPEINNPWKTSTVDDYSDDFNEILFYYTDTKHDDNAITDDELTPIVLENNILVGWGWTFLLTRYPEADFGPLLPISK
jgi:hypothetical protein